MGQHWAEGWRWIDPTLRLQRGPDAVWRLPHYGFGLVLAPGNQTLAPVVPPPVIEPDTVLRDDIELSSEGHALIRHTLILSGHAADEMRGRLDAEPLTEISLRWSHFIGRFYEGLEEMSELVATDDAETGVVTLRGVYRLRDAVFADEAGQPSFSTVGYGVRLLFDPINTTRRRWPLQTVGLRHVRHEIVVDAPYSLALQVINEGTVRPEVRHTVTGGSAANRFRVAHEWKTRREWVPAAEVAAHGEILRHLMKVCVLQVVAAPQATETATAP